MAPRISRREFLTSSIMAGVAVQINFLRPAEALPLPEQLDPSWIGADGRPKHRLDAIAKVTGSKVFARDFRARDMPGWPQTQSHAFLIRATKADRTFESIDLTVLGPDLQPDRIVLAEDLARDGISVPDPSYFGPGGPKLYGEVFLVPAGQVPYLIGEPVALLIYHDFARYDAAKRSAKFNEAIVRYGAVTGPRQLENYYSERHVRIGGDNPSGPDRLTTKLSGSFNDNDIVWADANGGLAAAAELRGQTSGPDAGTLVLQRDFEVPFYDASAMEADNGNVWYDASGKGLHVIFATQSAHWDVEMITTMVKASRFGLDRIDGSFTNTVGYGTKDHSIFPLYCAIAGLYAEGRPVRLANDRFEQFQSTMKAHAFSMKETLAVDKATGKFTTMIADFVCHGGGRCNYTPWVASGGISFVESSYYIRSSDISVVGLASRAVEAGSTRGFGAIQGNAATEMLVDEIAAELGLDPIELRQRNLYRLGDIDPRGVPRGGTPRGGDILAKAAAHPVWTDRAARKTAFETADPGKRYGVGFALTTKGYGPGGATVSLAFDKTGRLSMRSAVLDIGTGSATTQATIVARIVGKAPDENAFSLIDWPEMPLNTKYAGSPEEQAALDADPHYTRSIVADMSYSNSVNVFAFCAEQAARSLLTLSLWPAALALWNETGGALALADAQVTPEGLAAPGKPALPFPALAAKAHEMGGIVAMTVHTVRNEDLSTAEAEFDVPGVGRHKLGIDALAVQYGEGAPAERKALMTTAGFQFVDRSNLSFRGTSNPPRLSNYSTTGILVELAVDLASGEIEMLSHHTILDCGPQVVPAFVSGQVQGGTAMGIGFALHEYLPPFEDGAGDGTWNWNRYRLPRGHDVAVWTQTAEVLPPVSAEEQPKGIGEVVTMAIIPATANAVAHALGRRFYSFPITAEKVLEALS